MRAGERSVNMDGTFATGLNQTLRAGLALRHVITLEI